MCLRVGGMPCPRGQVSGVCMCASSCSVCMHACVREESCSVWRSKCMWASVVVCVLCSCARMFGFSHTWVHMTHTCWVHVTHTCWGSRDSHMLGVGPKLLKAA